MLERACVLIPQSVEKFPSFHLIITSIRIKFHLSEEKKREKPIRGSTPIIDSIVEDGDYRDGNRVAKWLHRVEHAQARGRRSVGVNALVQGDRKLSPLPSSLPSPSFSFSLASTFLSLPLVLRLVLSRTRTDGGLSRNDLCVPMCRNNRPLREKTRVVGTIVSRRRWRWPRTIANLKVSARKPPVV